MKEFKGTPGPWAVHEIGPHWNNKSLTHLEITFGEDGECICDTVYHRADANLIAAAPELLEALRQLRDYVEDTYPTKEYGYAWAEESHPMSLARAAIAKALGETK